MTAPKQLAFISPRDGIAGLPNGGEEAVTLCSPPEAAGRMLAVSDYSDRFPDTAVIEAPSPQIAIQQLQKLQDKSLALDLSLLLFDDTVSKETRREIARDLNEILGDRECRDYVLDIILASPLPSSADVAGAIDACTDCNLAKQLISLISESQERVSAAHSAWLAVRINPLVRQAGTDSILGTLIRWGVFRRLVEEAKSQRDLDLIKPQILLSHELRSRCDARILANLVSEYRCSLPPGLAIAQVSVGTPLKAGRDLQSIRSAASDRQARPTLNREQAERQVERIADLYRQGNDLTADKFLEELVESQTLSVADEVYAVKSLCNIATRCTDNGRRDISLRCLARAFNYPNGIDAVLYVQMGNALRDLRRYDEALACYDEAKRLEGGAANDSILLQIIRTSIARGNYRDALLALEQHPDRGRRPQIGCLLGTLHRRLGNLRDARDCYSNVLCQDPSYHQAIAGLAETNKQTGRHWKAIKRYNKILRTFSNLDASSWKIYSLSLAFLYRITHQYDVAGRVLSNLLSQFPIDPDVHLQLAKLYRLQRNSEKAAFHFEQANAHPLDKLATQLYLAGTGRDSDAISRLEDREIEQILPEDEGTAACYQAIIDIRKGDFESALHSLLHSKSVDRLQKDFESVLRFHANKRLDQKFEYKSEYSICRIAKRGQSELRNAIQAIDRGDFDAAQQCESEMCLLVA